MENANIRITPEEFKHAFETATAEQKSTLLNCWSSQPKFTAYVTNVLMPRIARLLECAVKAEYRRIDFVLTRGFQRVVAAIEHENNFSSSALSEIVKLKSVDASLGVLITYISQRQRARMIKEYNEAMAIGRDQNIAPKCGNILIIIGPYGMTKPKILTWEYYAYDGQEFKLL